MKEPITTYFIVLGGAVAWALHFTWAYVIGEFTCVATGTAFTLFGLDASAWFIIALTLPCLGASLFACRLSWARRGEFIGRFGIYANGLFSAAILAQTLPAFFFLKGC